MAFSLKTRSLRLIVSFIVLTYGVAVFGLIFFIEIPAIHKNFYERNTQQVKMMLNRTQGSVEGYLRKNNLEGVVQDLTFIGSRKDVKLIVLLDENKKPIASSNFAVVNNFDPSIFSKKEWETIEESKKEKRSTLLSKEDFSIILGAVPVIVGHTKDSLVANRIGYLVLVMDYRYKIDSNTKLIYKQVLLEFGLLVVVSLLILLLLNKLIYKPITELEKVAKDFSDGNYTSRYEGDASLEIYWLAESFNTMAQNIEFSHKYLKAIIDSQPQIVVINDGEKLIDTNKAFFNLFTEFKNIEDFQKKFNCICDFFVDEPGFLSKTVDGTRWIEYLAENKDTFHKVKIKREDKEIILSVHFGEFVIDQTKRYIISFVDITQLEKIQNHLKDVVSEELEKRIKVENKMLQQSKLAQMGEMVTMISHHWRQPLNIIGLEVQNLKESYEYGELDKDTIDKAISVVMGNVKNLSRTLQTLSSYMVHWQDKKVFDVSQVTQELIDLMKPELDSKFIVMTVENIEALHVYGVASLYGQILQNLIRNAEEALTESEQSKREINVRLAKEGIDHVKLSVKDNGTGIDDDTMSRIFEPFFTTKGPANKTGLGLYIVKMFVEEQFGGVITVSSSSASTEFTVSLPLYKEGKS